MQTKRYLLVSILFCCYLVCKGGVPALEREVTLTFTNEKLNNALSKIQEQTGLIFSYPSNILNNAPPVSIQLKQKTVREALALLLPKTITFKAKSNYIILKEKPPEKAQKKTELSGYVYDKTTEKKLANVTLYDKVTLQTVTTNEYGYYSISLPKEEQCLTVNKENYRDTCVSLTYLRDGPLTNITIDPVDKEQLARDSVKWRQKFRDFSQSTNDLFKRFKGYVNTINVKDTLTRNFQVSLIPFVGTNGLMSGNVYNKYSINVFGGYSRGTRALELGGFFNIDREKVTGAQLAGFFNIVGDTMKGAQMAGFFNITGRHVSGLQLAGFLNMNIGSVKGFQGAGLLNINAKSVKGVSAAGMLNLNRFSVKGVQVAGMMNITGDTLDGVSIAGYMNLSWHSKNSLEIAGLMNSARYGDQNKQIAALVNNTAKGNTRLQISSLMNRAHNVTGMQIGLFNYADSASGLPLGVLSFVKNGVHQFEFSSDEVFLANAGLRTGVRSFYNVLSAGFRPGSGDLLWNFGYGAGTQFKIKNKLNADFTATMHHVSSGKFYFATSELYKFYFGLEYKLGKKICLSGGPTFNLYWSDKLLPAYKTTYYHIAPYYTFNKELRNDFNLKGWYGLRLCLRFF